jgi:hypothetical protein
MTSFCEENNSFDFSKISLSPPILHHGNYYVMNLLLNITKDVIIQPPKCLTKNGINKIGKKYYCDLIFETFNEPFFNLIENLEAKCHQIISSKSKIWFQNKMSIEEVKEAFNNTIHPSKTGKYFTVKTMIEASQTNDEPLISIYDEENTLCDYKDITITTNTHIIPVLKIKGIKFNTGPGKTSVFQFICELPQVMLAYSPNIFNKCLINKNISNTYGILNYDCKNNASESEFLNDDETKDMLEENKECDEAERQLEQNKERIQEEENTNFGEDILEEPKNDFLNYDNYKDDIEEFELHYNSINEIDDNDIIDKDTIQEIKNVKPLILEPLTLKNPSTIYYKIYQEARNKAKEAKKNALIAYLEAKKIKNTYMIEDNQYSDNEIDNDINNVTETELQKL